MTSTIDFNSTKSGLQIIAEKINREPSFHEGSLGFNLYPPAAARVLKTLFAGAHLRKGLRYRLPFPLPPLKIPSLAIYSKSRQSAIKA